jgi:hypothetical protein
MEDAARSRLKAESSHPVYQSNSENGVSLLEFTLILPFLVLMLSAMFELGLSVYKYPIALDAAREAAHSISKILPNGAGAGSVLETQVLSTVCARLDQNGLSPTTFEVSIEQVDISGNDSLLISVSQASGTSFIPLPMFDLSKMFRAQTVIRLRSSLQPPISASTRRCT